MHVLLYETAQQLRVIAEHSEYLHIDTQEFPELTYSTLADPYEWLQPNLSSTNLLSPPLRLFTIEKYKDETGSEAARRTER